MIIWFLFSVIALLLAFFSQKKYFPKEHKWAQFILAIWLGWFVSFGSRGMQDQPGYVLAYNSFGDLPIFNLLELLLMHINSLKGTRIGMEIGYQTLCSIFNKCGFSYVGFAFFYSIILNNLVIKFIYRYNYPLISVLIFIVTVYYSQQANLVRQMMAVAIFLYATKFIISKQFQFYLFFIILASLFHVSSLILLPVYFFILNYRFKIILTLLWFISLALYYIGENNSLIQSIRLVYISYYEIGLDKDESVGIDNGFSWFNNLVVLFILFTVKKNSATQPLVSNIFILGVIILNFRIVSDWFFRLSLYFTIFYVVLLPTLFKDLNETNLIKIINKKLLNKLFLIPIIYYLYILFSYVFRNSGVVLGYDMYTFNEIWK